MTKKRKKLRWFNVINNAVFAVLGFLTIYPLWYVFVASIEPYNKLIDQVFVLFPEEITFAAYEKLFQSETILRAFGVTVFSTVVGTILSLFFIAIGAYVFSIKYFPGKKICLNIVLLTMMFGGGVIPMYMTLKTYHLLDNIWVYIIPSLINTFYLIIMKTTFQGIPESIREAAEIDGCSHWKMLWKIYMPLSKAAFATIALFIAVDKWNDLYTGIYYIIDSTKYSLQVVIYNMISSIDPSTSGAIVTQGQAMVNEQVKYACIIFATVPILIVYPFLQKHFTKGVLVGSIKD